MAVVGRLLEGVVRLAPGSTASLALAPVATVNGAVHVDAAEAVVGVAAPLAGLHDYRVVGTQWR